MKNNLEWEKFVERTTTIEKPYFLYDPIKQCEVSDNDNNNIESSTNNTIPILAVDILPSEVPKESSEHFGKAVRIVLDELKSVKSKQLCDQNNISKNFDPLLLPQGLVSQIVSLVSILFCHVTADVNNMTKSSVLFPFFAYYVQFYPTKRRMLLLLTMEIYLINIVIWKL